MRLAPRDELAAAARVAPLLRAARDLALWAARRQDSGLATPDPAAAAEDLDLTQEELEAAWQVAAGARMLDRAGPAGRRTSWPRGTRTPSWASGMTRSA